MKKSIKIVQRDLLNQIFNCTNALPYFTVGKRYQEEGRDFDLNTNETSIVFIDDDGDRHPIEEKVFSKHFEVSAFQ